MTNSAQAIPASVEREREMPSSVIRDTSYDETTKEMRVTFVSGRVYVYDGVPRVIYNAFCNAPSKGAFFNVAIRGRYQFHEIVQDRKRSAR
jgi:lysyl-tRNA synthetase class 2